MKHFTFLLILIISNFVMATGQTISDSLVLEEVKKLEETVMGWGTKYGHPGAEIYVTDRKNNVIYHNAFGVIKKNQQFILGSATKPFTYGLVLILISEGKLNFDTKVNTYLPEVDSKVTIEMLLSHESGYVNSNKFDEWFLGNSFEECLNKFVSGGFSGLTGYHKYAEDNSFMLAKIVEIEMGMPYYEAWLEKICKPLNLKNTYGELPNTYFNENDFYVTQKDTMLAVNFLEWRKSDGLKFIHPSAGLFSTAHDYAIFLNEFRDLVTPEVFEKATQQQNNQEYGYGYRVKDEVGLYGHTGATGFAGFSNGEYTFIYWSPSPFQASKWKNLLAESDLFIKKTQGELRYYKELLPLNNSIKFNEPSPKYIGNYTIESVFEEYRGRRFTLNKEGGLLKREVNGRILDYWGQLDADRFMRIHRSKKYYYPASIIYWNDGVFEIYSKEAPEAEELQFIVAKKE